MLTDLESVFWSLKSELGLRPVYQHKEDRCDGHLFITVLGYQAVQVILGNWGSTGSTKAGPRCGTSSASNTGSPPVSSRWTAEPSTSGKLPVQKKNSPAFTPMFGR
jgi:hypothetical protein